MKRALLLFFCCVVWVFGFAAMGFSADGATLYKRCESCHGPDGAKPPHVLKGQKAAELQTKLQGYAAGTYGGAKKSLMTGVVKGLSPADIQALAEYIAKL